MLSKELEYTLNKAFKEARDRHHEFMTVEHLLLALLENPTAVEILKACGADMAKLKKDVSEFIEETTPLIPLDDTRETQPTLGFQRVLQRAVVHVQSSGKKERSNRRQCAGGYIQRTGVPGGLFSQHAGHRPP